MFILIKLRLIKHYSNFDSFFFYVSSIPFIHHLFIHTGEFIVCFHRNSSYRIWLTLCSFPGKNNTFLREKQKTEISSVCIRKDIMTRIHHQRDTLYFYK